MPNERRSPTHVLTIQVPLNLDEAPQDYHPVRDAVTVCLSISRAAFAGRICDDPVVAIEEGAAWKPAT